MKPAAYQRHKYSADLYKYVLKKVGADEVVEYYFTETISLTAGIDQNQRLNITTDEPLAIGYLLVNIRDRQGTPILADMAWQISTAIPLLNAFGNVDGFRCRAVKFQGEIG